jgi:alanyl-tRNA synthetase
LVDNDLLRFDFAADRLLDAQELANIEKRINQIIYLACDVIIQEMSIDDATKL